MKEVAESLDTFESDPKIGAIVITGSKKAFAGGLCSVSYLVS